MKAHQVAQTVHQRKGSEADDQLHNLQQRMEYQFGSLQQRMEDQLAQGPFLQASLEWRLGIFDY